MVDSHAFHLMVDTIGSLEHDAIHEIGSRASSFIYRPHVALTFFKPSIIDNFSTDLNRRIDHESFYNIYVFFLYLYRLRFFLSLSPPPLSFYFSYRNIFINTIFTIIICCASTIYYTRQNDTIGRRSIEGRRTIFSSYFWKIEY